MKQHNTLERLKNHFKTRQAVTRFAPSPTGHLHLGHLASVYFLWGIAKIVNAKIQLRIEDHDRHRSKPEFETSICEDLEWLGLKYQSFSRQSDSTERYQASLRKLQSKSTVYECFCSRREIKSRQNHLDSGLVYDRFCLSNPSRSRPDKKPSLRLLLQPGHITFLDLGRGRQRVNPDVDYGDFSLMDAHGFYSYHFSSTVDDIEDGVNLIVRGNDIFDSTGAQIYLRNLLDPKPAEDVLFSTIP